MSVYEFRDNLYYFLNNSDEADPQTIGETLEELRDSKGGEFTPRELWESQKEPEAPLHQHFEWDDEKCGVKYRDDQARKMTRSIKLVFAKGTEEEKSVTAFSSVTDRNDTNKRVYVSTVEAMSDDERRNEILQNAVNALRSWRRRYSELEEFGEAVMKIDQAAEELEAAKA